MVLQALMDGTDPKPQLANKFVSGGRLNSRNTLDELMAVGCNGSICFGPSGIQADNVADNDAYSIQCSSGRGCNQPLLERSWK